MVETNEITITDDNRLYVIGDIHGRSDLLDQMIQKITGDLTENPANNAATVTLGDYFDRGPDSRGVLDRLARNPFPTPHIALKGNHEELFEQFLKDPNAGPQWRHLGGLETLFSYGVPVGSLMRGRGFEEASQLLRDKVPSEHLAFLSSLRSFITTGRYFLCHAGVRPGIPLERQEPRDLLWIREEFLKSTRDFGKIVVHGHTPVQQPEVLPNRINIDTGAFMTGSLTCIVLDGASHRFLTTR
jgi:serine/threonine protein phosphatase 1